MPTRLPSAYKAAALPLRHGGIVASAGFGPAPSAPFNAAPPASWATRTWSLCSVLIRGPPAYEAGALPLSYRGVAAGQGLEPRFAGSEPAVLPLDDPAMVGEAGVEPAAGPVPCRLPSTRLPPLRCAARVSNPVPRGKSPVHHPSCLQRLERHTGIEPASSAWKAEALAVGRMPHGGSRRYRACLSRFSAGR